MPLPLVPIVILGGLGLFLAFSKGDSAPVSTLPGNPAGPDGTPESKYTEAALAAMCEWHAVDGGKQARYFRPAIGSNSIKASAKRPSPWSAKALSQ